MSTNLEAELRAQLTTAMKAKDTRTSNLVRMINTKIMERRTAKGFSGTIDDALILDVIATYKKSMEKARADYVTAGERAKDQLDELDFEVAWCSKFLPTQMTEAELRDAVAKAVGELPQKDPKMAGRVIGAIKKQFGDRADAQLVKKLADELAAKGILIRTRSMRGVAEEAPGAYKDVDLVAEATEQAGLARRVAFLRPKVCIKG